MTRLKKMNLGVVVIGGLGVKKPTTRGRTRSDLTRWGVKKIILKLIFDRNSVFEVLVIEEGTKSSWRRWLEFKDAAPGKPGA